MRLSRLGNRCRERRRQEASRHRPRRCTSTTSFSRDVIALETCASADARRKGTHAKDKETRTVRHSCSGEECKLRQKPTAMLIPFVSRRCQSANDPKTTETYFRIGDLSRHDPTVLWCTDNVCTDIMSCSYHMSFRYLKNKMQITIVWYDGCSSSPHLRILHFQLTGMPDSTRIHFLVQTLFFDKSGSHMYMNDFSATPTHK